MGKSRKKQQLAKSSDSDQGAASVCCPKKEGQKCPGLKKRRGKSYHLLCLRERGLFETIGIYKKEEEK
ncbi:hypothetical protein NPIL_257121 [Nephila pilipes]|uniref:Uncharacterized protein n=1 Tax=Nephila pilipes TaxID=299642 RepID=A0A8X6NHI4_NEPPI|nr:hypothetical protein NPIL_257121 [Nephila pilipes]